jgi:hypothetical protein
VSRAKLNLSQRIVIVVGLGVALRFFGDWVTTLGSHSVFGWVSYAPLSNESQSTGPAGPGGLHYGWRILIWIALTVVWAAVSIIVLRSREKM